MKKERVLEELQACKRRLEEMTEIVERRISAVENWSSSDVAKPTYANNVVDARRALENIESDIAKLD